MDQVLSGGSVDARPADVREVLNYNSALDLASRVARRPDFEWSQELFRRLNATVIRDLGDDERGEYRQQPVTVGGVYSPPESGRLPALMARLVEWLRSDNESHPLIWVGLTHLNVVSIVAPAGLFVVDTKSYLGKVEIRDLGGLFQTDDRLYVGGRDRSKLADNMGWQVTAVETFLASIRVFMPITPVLCFVDAEWPLLFRTKSFRGVLLERPRSLRERISATHALDAVAIDKLARILEKGFPTK